MTRVDITISQEGDLQLGQSKLADDGTPLLDKNNNIVRDIRLGTERQAITQGVICRIKTQAPDWYTYPHLGANLEDFFGEPNTPETATEMATQITNILTYDNFIRYSDLDVHVIPVNQTELVFYINIKHDIEGFMSIPIPFNINEGLGV